MVVTLSVFGCSTRGVTGVLLSLQNNIFMHKITSCPLITIRIPFTFLGRWFGGATNSETARYKQCTSVEGFPILPFSSEQSLAFFSGVLSFRVAVSDVVQLFLSFLFSLGPAQFYDDTR